MNRRKQTPSSPLSVQILLKRVIKKNWKLSAALAAVSLGVVLFSLAPPQLLRFIIDERLTAGVRQGLLSLALLYLLIAALSGVFGFLKEGILAVLGQRLIREIRSEMMKKLTRTEALSFSEADPGFLVSRMTNDVDAIASLFTGGIVSLAIDCVKIAGIVLSIWMFSGRLGFFVLLLLPLIYGLIRVFQRRMLSAQITNRILVGRVNTHIAESLKNMRMIKAFHREQYMEDRYRECLADNYETVEKVNFYDSIFSPIIITLRAVIIAAVVLSASADLRLLGITVGMTAATIDLITNIFSPIESLGMELQGIQQAVSGIKRVNDFYAAKEEGEKEEALTADSLVSRRDGFSLVFDGVHFRYPRGPEVIRGVSLEIRAGERVVLMGRTGVGKSTLFGLAMGFLEPAAGKVTVCGTDVLRILNREKRGIIGYVEQSFHPVSGTVAEQISLKDPTVTREQVQQALEFVGLLDYVNTLELGLDTPVAREGLFSQGQRQLLAIARAIVKDPPLLLLDEITANLDSVTERQILSVLQKAGTSRTVLSISHRLSAESGCDRIVIMEEGKIKSSGTPQELLNTDAWYRSLVELEHLT